MKLLHLICMILVASCVCAETPLVSGEAQSSPYSTIPPNTSILPLENPTEVPDADVDKLPVQEVHVEWYEGLFPRRGGSLYDVVHAAKEAAKRNESTKIYEDTAIKLLGIWLEQPDYD